MIGQADKLLVVVLYHRPILSSDKEQRFLVRYRLKWQYLAFRFEQPRDNSWVVGNPEVMARTGSAGITSGLPVNQ